MVCAITLVVMLWLHGTGMRPLYGDGAIGLVLATFTELGIEVGLGLLIAYVISRRWRRDRDEV
jgi:hypothetical protein